MHCTLTGEHRGHRAVFGQCLHQPAAGRDEAERVFDPENPRRTCRGVFANAVPHQKIRADTP